MATDLRPYVFIGSSSEGKKLANELQVLLDEACETSVWSQGVFGLSQGTLESLVAALEQFDFAVLVLTPDDVITSRGADSPAPRDNVLFELGLFMGGLGRDRTFIVHERNGNIKLPSDLAGVTAATFQRPTRGDLQSAMGTAATKIRKAVQHLGVRDRKRLKGLTQAQHGFEAATSQIHTMLRLLTRSRMMELDLFAAKMEELKEFLTRMQSVIAPADIEKIKRDLAELETTLKESEKIFRPAG